MHLLPSYTCFATLPTIATKHANATLRNKYMIQLEIEAWNVAFNEQMAKIYGSRQHEKNRCLEQLHDDLSLGTCELIR
jgi:hypothetical protein